jgi:hypothetical protein
MLDERQVDELRTRLETMIRHGCARADELLGAPRVKPGETPRLIYFQAA